MRPLSVHVLYIIGKLAPHDDPRGLGGCSTHLLQLIENLDRERYEVSVWVFGGGRQGPRIDRLRGLGIEPRFLGLDNLVTFSALPKLLRMAFWIRRGRFNLVHTLLFTPNVFGVLAARAVGAKVILASKRELVDWKGRGQVFLSRLANSQCTRILVPSEATGRSVLEVERPDAARIVVIHNGVDLSRFDASRWSVESVRATLGIESGVFVAGTIGHMTPIKDHETLLRAWVAVVELDSRAVLIHVGGGPLEAHLKEVVKTLGLTDNVVFYGRQVGISRYLAAMDVYVSSSLSEGFSNSILEAMAMSLPVVATAVGGNPEAVVEGKTGSLVPVGDSNAMSERLIHLLQDAPQRRALGACARRTVEERFSAQRMAGRYMELYESVFRDRGGSSVEKQVQRAAAG